MEYGDNFIVDRGFRDSVQAIEDNNINCYMPHLLEKTRKQFTTKEANESRKITMIRWLVEAVNGRFKNKFKFLSSVIPNSYLPKLSTWFRVACALLNAYSPPLFTETTAHQQLVNIAKAKEHKPNNLKSKIEDLGLERKRACWVAASSESFTAFPTLNSDDLKEITVGVYQIEMAKYYCHQHIQENGEYTIKVHGETKNLLRATLQSRFRRSHHHNLWIEFLENGSGVGSVLGKMGTNDTFFHRWFLKLQ